MKDENGIDNNKFLVVDDEKFITRLMTGYFSKMYETHDANSIKTAKNKIDEIEFAVVLLDINLHDGSGIDLLKYIKEKYKYTEVIIITGYADVSTTVKALRHGALDYILKPSSMDNMSAVIDKAFNTRLLNLKTTTLEDTIHILTKATEKRDPYTYKHQIRVAELSSKIGHVLGLDRKNLDMLYLCSIVHDVGKIYMPMEILNKPGPLTTQEMSLVKTHSIVGYDILKDIKSAQHIAQIVLQHHEKLDGSGYPNALKEKDILHEAKIIGVSDTVEAICSHRPYRPALTKEIALDEINKNKDKLYDAAIVNACVSVFEDKEFRFT